MGKKKKKMHKAPHHDDEDAKNDSPNSMNRHRSCDFPSPSFTNAIIITLSLSGILNAKEYTTFLNDVDRIITNYHGDEEIDAVLSAMDVCEQERRSFASALHSLAISVLDLIQACKPPKASMPSMSSMSSMPSMPSTWLHIAPVPDPLASSPATPRTHSGSTAERLENVEESCVQLQGSIQMYKASILHQKTQIKQCQQNILYCKSDAVSQPLQWTYQAKAKCASLINEFKRQLRWEQIVIMKLEVILTNGSLYSWFCNSHERENGDLNPPIQHTISLCKDMMRWSGIIESCSFLQKPEWIELKYSLLLEVVKGNQMIQEDNSSSCKVIEKNNEMKMEGHRDHYEHHHCEDEEYEQIDRGEIFATCTINNAINIFFGRTVFTSQQHQYDIVQKELQYLNNHNDDPTQKWNMIRMKRGPLFLLLVGSSNSGKTHFCNSLCNDLRNHDPPVKVLRPKLPSDFIGPTIGSFENSLLSLFIYAQNVASNGKKCIIILDDIEHILGESFAESSSQFGKNTGKINSRSESHAMIRIRGTFFGIMNNLKANTGKNASAIMNNLLVLCTAGSKGDETYKACFDQTYNLSDPDWEERHHIIEKSFDISTSMRSNDEYINHLLSTIATSSMGKSRGEISLYCREALNIIINQDKKGDNNSNNTLAKKTKYCRKMLESVLRSMQSITPDSLKELSTDQSIEMRVLSSKELQRDLILDDKENAVFPLLGENALDAWKKLKSTVITPLCQAAKLDDLLYGNMKKSKEVDILFNKSITCGVLISGPPGVGKTALAYYCAAYASKMEPSLRLLDVSCTSLVSKEVGGSEKNISRLFQIARSSAPCIVLLDGIENISQVRGNDNTTEGTMDRLLSTLLIEMDGVISPSEFGASMGRGIAIIGVTHSPISFIDPALRRPGRLEKNIHLKVPDGKARREILEREMDDVDIDFNGAEFFDPKSKSQLWECISMKSEGKSAAEIVAIGKNARIAALRRALDRNDEKTVIYVSDFFY